MTSQNPTLLNRIEAAEYIGVRPQTLASWLSTRRFDLPVVRIGRLIKYTKADLDAFILSRRHSPTQGNNNSP